MAKKDNTALAWGIGLATLAVAGVGIYFYEKSQPAAPKTSPPALPPGGVAAPAPTAIAACQQVDKVVAARLANMGQPASILQTSYNYWAAQCTAAGGTPAAWPG